MKSPAGPRRRDPHRRRRLLILNLLNGAYGIGSMGMPARQANLMGTVAKGVFAGGLPWTIIGIAAVVIARGTECSRRTVDAGLYNALFGKLDATGARLLRQRGEVRVP